MVLPRPLPAVTIPETAAAFFSFISGVIAPIMMPNDSAPAPAGNTIPKSSNSGHMEWQNGIPAKPAAMRAAPVSRTKPFDLFIAKIPKNGCVVP